MRPGARFETKYVADGSLYHDVVHWLRMHPAGFRILYPPRWVNSVYFDNAELASYDENLAGVSRRAKLRLRWYGDKELPSRGVLEVKQRDDRLGFKQTCTVTLPSNRATLTWRSNIERMCQALPPQFRSWFREHPQAVMQNRYLRDYYLSADGAVRSTVDRRLAVYDQRYAGVPHLRRRVPIVDVTVLELKFAPELQARAAQIVKDVPLRLSRHSKYVGAVGAMHGY